MKTSVKILLFLVVFINATIAQTEIWGGKIEHITGDVWICDSLGQPLETCRKVTPIGRYGLRNSDISVCKPVVVGPNSSATVILLDGSVAHLSPGEYHWSSFVRPPPEPQSLGRRIQLLRGKIVSKFKRSGAVPTDFVTPSGGPGVRGTVLSVSANEPLGTDRVLVYRGNVILVMNALPGDTLLLVGGTDSAAVKYGMAGIIEGPRALTLDEVTNFEAVFINPIAFFVWEPEAVQPGEVLLFVNLSSEGIFAPIVSHQWNFGDGATSEDMNPQHTYSQSGEFLVSLLVVDSSSRSDTTWRYVPMGVPPQVVLFTPVNNAVDQPLYVILTWQYLLTEVNYHLQVSLDSSFNSIIVEDTTLIDSLYIVGPLQYDTRYYWRVGAKNASGLGNFSVTRNFTTIVAPPAAPTLLSPADGATGVSTTLTLSWNASTGATSYRLQVSTNFDFSSVVVDQSGITDTAYSVSGLANNTTYYWRVNGTNAGGTSNWSNVWSFTTTGPTAVEQISSDIPSQYGLHQNYPNPFNPVTTIEFSIPRSTLTTLKIYNALGLHIETLVNQNLAPGRYRTHWNGLNLPSGVYFYQIQSGAFIDTKKLILLR